MGQKVNPIGYRIGVNKDWDSKWYADKEYSDNLIKDIKIREFVAKNLKEAAIAKTVIERKKNRCDITLITAKPGVIIGRGGEDIEKLRKRISKLVKEDVYINIVEEKHPDLNAQIVAENIAMQIEQRAPFRSVQKRAIRNTMKAGAKGIQTAVSVHTLRADVDYGLAEANTTYGIIGVKVWIYKDEILPAKKVVKKGEDNHVDAKEN